MISGIRPNTKLVCKGGPYDGKSLSTKSAKTSTLKFSAKGYTGQYVYHQEVSYPLQPPHYKWVGTVPQRRVTDPNLNYIMCR